MKKKDFDHIDKLAQDAFEHFEVPFDAGDWMEFQQQLNKESTIDQVAKDALKAYEVPLDPNGWEEFEKVQQRKKSGLLYIWWCKAAEAGIMALLLLGTLFNLPCSQKKSINNNSFAYGPTTTLTTDSDNNNANSLTNAVVTTTGTTSPLTTAPQRLEHHTTTPSSAAYPSHKKASVDNRSTASTNNVEMGLPIGNSAATPPKQTAQHKPTALAMPSSDAATASSLPSANTTVATATMSDKKATMESTTDYSNNNASVNSNNTIDNSNGTNSTIANPNKAATPNNVPNNTVTTSSFNSLVQLLAINSSTLQLPTPTSKNKTIEPITLLKSVALKTPHICRHYLGATLGVGANLGTSMGKTSIGYTGGLTYEKEFSSKISLTIGLSSSYKRYDRSDLIRLDRSAIDGKIYEMTQIKTSNLVLIEIPLEVNYTCFRSDKWRIYANVGLSANAIFSRTYTGSQQLQVDGLSISTELNSNDFERGLVEGGAAPQNLYLSVGGGVGVERKLDDNLSLYMLPTYRHGINSVHNDLIHTFNVNIGIKKALGK
ncbi:MAG: outer membrane beta-barrel protein [Aureispira sp.]